MSSTFAPPTTPPAEPPVPPPTASGDSGGASSPPPPPPPARRRRRRRWLRRLAAAFAVLMLTAGGIAWWALDEYVIDHVEIADVDAYEAQVRVEREAADATSSTSGDSTSTTTGAMSVASDTDSTESTGVTAGATATDSSGTAGSDVVTTESSYSSDSMTIDISTVVTGSGNGQVTYYVADVVVTDATQLRGGFANNQFGENIIADSSEIAEYYDAVFAINGDYYGFRDTGIVIRNGVLYRDDGARMGLAVYADGTLAVYDETTTSGQELLDAGVWNTVSFGPALLVDGQVVDGIDDVEVDTNFGNHSIQGRQPRTGIGMIDVNHFVFVVVDGRSPGYSAGVTMTELAEIFQQLGASVAYNLDGGGSSTMYFDGSLVNDPLGRGNERGTSDILYLAEAAA